jgi:DNA polymerase-1
MSFIYIQNRSDIPKLVEGLSATKEISLDVETDGLDELTCKLLLIQLKANGLLYVINYRKLEPDVSRYIVQLIIDSKKLVIGHNIKFDVKVIYRHTGELITNLYDTMLAEVLIHQGVGEQYYPLDYLTNLYCSVSLDKTERKTFENYEGDFFTEQQLLYSALDVEYLDRIKDRQLKEIEKSNQLKVWNTIERPLEAVVAMMELEGQIIDREWWKNLEKIAKVKELKYRTEFLDCVFSSIDFSKYKNALDLSLAFKVPVKTQKLTLELSGITDLDCVKDWVRNHINMGSWMQVMAMLNLLGIPVKDTNEKTLNKFKNHDIIKLLLNYREQGKVISTYGESFLNKLHPLDGRLHSEFHQLGAHSGRFSATKGAHQIPKDKDDAPTEESYRSAFIGGEDHLILSADYSQAELRLMGSVSEEPEFINAFKNNIDMHIVTATKLFKIDVKDVTSDKRKKGKTLNFAVGYGSSEYGLWKNFDIPIDEGKVYLEDYYKGYPVLKEFTEKVGNTIIKLNYSVTMAGRRRYFVTKGLENWQIDGVKREGVNHIIQGTCADMVKLAMIYIFYNNPFGKLLKIVSQVHDEIVIKIHKDIKDEAEKFVRECMLKAEQPFLGSIPAEVDINSNVRWSH